MKTATVVKVLVFLSLLVATLIYFIFFYSGKLNNEHVGQLVNTQLASSGYIPKNSRADIDSQTLLTAVDQATADTVDSNVAKVDYDADWCIAGVDLSQEDFDYYLRELENWSLATGQVIPSLSGRSADTKAQYLLPYMEANYNDLRRQIKEDNIFAMISALYRKDFDLDSQRRIAQRLIVKGQTGVSLSHLVMLDLLSAKTAFKKSGQLTNDIEKKLYRALSYTAYGIDHFDLDATLTYLDIVSASDFPVELKEAYLSGKSNKVSGYSEKLQQLIIQSRERENLLLAAENEIPKAAKHNFESTLAYLYREYGNELHMLKTVLPDASGSMLDHSKCVQQHIEFFNTTKR